MNFANVNWMFVKTLEGIQDAEELIMGTSYRTRKAIRKAEKNGVFLEQATLETLDEFYDALSTAGDEKGFIYREREYYEHLLRTTSSEFTKLMMAKIDIPEYRRSITERLEAESAAAAELRREVEETGSKKKANRLKVVQDLVDSYERSLKDIERFPDSVGVATVAAIHFVCLRRRSGVRHRRNQAGLHLLQRRHIAVLGHDAPCPGQGLHALQLLRHLRH